MSNYSPKSNYTSGSSLEREELKRRIKGYRGRFKLDFTENYLNRVSVDTLKHILLAVKINARSKSKGLESKTK